MRHPEYQVALKIANIDAKLIPVIVWMNHLFYTHTISCCQGNWSVDGTTYGPHIMYVCVNPEEQQDIKEMLDEFGTITPNYDGYPGCYYFDFHSEESVDRLVAKLHKRYWS